MRKSLILNARAKSPFNIHEKRRRLSEKFQITKENVTLEDILSIIEKIHLEKNISEKTANKIFSELDLDKKGVVKTDDFLDHIYQKQSEEILDKDELALFYDKINQELVTKSEIILTKLKKLREKAWVVNDKTSIDDIDWIITTLHEENIFEPEYSELHKTLSSSGLNGIEQLVKYSQIEDNQRKESDIQAILVNRRKSSLGMKCSMRVPTESENKDSCLSTILSPSILARLSKQLSIIDSFEFNIFEVDDLVQRKSAIYMAHEIFSRTDFLEDEIVDKEKFNSFLNEIVYNYDRAVAYHNDLHAADVMQTIYVMIIQSDLQNRLQLDHLDTFAMLIAALCHDFKHTGQSNTYHINYKSDIAIRYNDSSVLENYHIAQTFKVLLKPENYILSKFSPEEYRVCRRRMIEGILATDMANHQKYLAAAKSKLETYEIKKGRNLEKMFADKNLSKIYENQQNVLNMCLHTADISNPSKPPKISEAWTLKVYAEFFAQGDLEKKNGLPVSLLCDRESTNVNKAMIGFINFVVAPTFEVMIQFLPELSSYYDYLKINLKRTEAAAKREEERKIIKIVSII